MCLVDSDNGVILVVVTLSGAVVAFDIYTDELIWKIDESLPNHSCPLKALGVTTDGRNHLFVRDRNNQCVHLFSADGKFVKTVLRNGECELLSFRHLRCCSNSASLAIVHCERKNKQSYISLIDNVI